MLLIQAADFALDFALANAGKSILANIAMMAITTKSSISVNAGDDLVFICLQLSILHPSCRRWHAKTTRTLMIGVAIMPIPSKVNGIIMRTMNKYNSRIGTMNSNPTTSNTGMTKVIV
jgi:hypothetical protein